MISLKKKTQLVFYQPYATGLALAKDISFIFVLFSLGKVSFVKREEIFAKITDVFEYFQPNFQHLYFKINSYNCS